MRIWAGILLLCFTLFPCFGDQYFFITDKQEKKRPRRWSLDEWIDQRDRMRMMDLWLALHSPAPYEFYFNSQYKTGKKTDGTYSGGWDLGFVGYAYLFGLEFSYDKDSVGSNVTGLFHLRLFGLQAQGTNIMLMGGLTQTQRVGVKLLHPRVGASLTWYLYKSFGIETGFHHLFEAKDGPSSLAVNRLNLGALLDFSFLRFYGGYFKTSETGSFAQSRDGAYLGLKLFF